MKQQNSFDSFFQNDYTQKIGLYSETYFALLNKEKKKAIITTLFFCLIGIATYVLLKLYNENIILSILFCLVFGGIIVCLYMNALRQIKQKLYVDINKLLYMDILSYLTGKKEIEFKPNSRISKDHFKNSKLFNLDAYNYNGENFTTCTVNDEKVIFSDIFIYNYKYKTLVDYFYEDGKTYKRTVHRKIPQKQYNGLYIEIPFHEDISSVIYLISSQFKNLVKGKVNGVLIYSGKKVDLENLEFEKDYNVYSDDETLARYIFDLPYMEKILEIDESIKDRKNIVYRTDQKLSIFIENFTVDELLSQKVKFENSIVSKDYVKGFFDILNSLMNIISVLQTNAK